jgi:hypothetical protein
MLRRPHGEPYRLQVKRLSDSGSTDSPDLLPVTTMIAKILLRFATAGQPEEE